MENDEHDKVWKAMSKAWESSKRLEDRLIEIKFCSADDTALVELSKVVTDSGVPCSQERADMSKYRIGVGPLSNVLIVRVMLSCAAELSKAISPMATAWWNARSTFEVTVKDETREIGVRNIKDLAEVIDAVKETVTSKTRPKQKRRRQ
jgi:hypothetical protein